MQEHHKLYGNKGLSDINKVVFNAGLVPVIVSAPVCMHVKDGEDWWALSYTRRRKVLTLERKEVGVFPKDNW